MNLVGIKLEELNTKLGLLYIRLTQSKSHDYSTFNFYNKEYKFSITAFKVLLLII